MAGAEVVLDDIQFIEGERSPLIYVPLRKLMDGVFADLHGSKPCTGRYQIEHEKIENAQFLGFKVNMKIDCASSLVPSGRINLAALGGCCYGNVDAEKDCMTKLLANIYADLKVFPADFSFIEIQAKRPLFSAMKNALDPAFINYRELHSLFAELHEGLFSPCLKISAWVGQSLNVSTELDLAAVSKFYAKLSQQLSMFESEYCHCRRLFEMIELKHVKPEAMRCFEASVPVSTDINWEVSRHTLEAVFREAVKKFKGGISKVETFDFGPGEVRCFLDIVGTPHHFSGDLADTKNIALAKLYYKVIKFVQQNFGFCVMDFHFEACLYVKSYIHRFDHNMRNVIKCADRMKVILDNLIGTFEESVAELMDRLQICDATGSVLESIHACGVLLRGQKIYVDSKLESLKGREVDRATLEWQLAHAN